MTSKAPGAADPVLAAAMEAVSLADGAGIGLLCRDPGLAPYVELRWVLDRELDPARIAREAGVGPGLAHAMAAAVECLDPFGPEVEAVRIRAWLRRRRETRPDAADAGVDAAWFAANPGRRHRVRPGDGGPVAVRLVADAGRPDRPVALPARCGEAVAGVAAEDAGEEATEEAAAEAFAEAALDWVMARQPGPLPDADAAWFGRRPERAHRIRPAMTAEVPGRDPAGWVTVAARTGRGAARLCAFEADLPRTDRGEADLRRTFRALAVEAACRAALGWDGSRLNHAAAEALRRGPIHGMRA